MRKNLKRTRFVAAASAASLSLVLGLSACSSAPKQDAGPRRPKVDPKALARYAPPALPSALTQRVQNFLNVRAPGRAVLDPSGQRFYFDWNVSGVSQIWSVGAPNAAPVALTQSDASTTLQDITPDGKWLILSRVNPGETEPGLYLQSPQGGELQPIQHLPGVRTEFQFVSDDSRFVYFRSNDAQPQAFFLYRHDLESGSRQTVFEDDGDWAIADHLPDGRLLLVRTQDGRWNEFYDWKPLGTREEQFPIRFQDCAPVLGQGDPEELDIRFGSQPREYLVRAARSSDFKRLFRFKDGQLTRISPETSNDVDSLAMDHTRKRIYYTLNEGGLTRLRALDARTFEELALPRFDNAEHLSVASLSRDGGNLTLGVENAQSPRRYVTYQWKTGRLISWTALNHPNIVLTNFVTARIEAFPARDGTSVPMIVRRPPECEGSDHACPVILHLHDGPEGQSRAGFSPLGQLFVDSGFVFVEPNIRGSTGYGRSWADGDNASNRLNAITDIEDAALFIKKAWMKRQIPPKVGLLGWRYGGYAALAAMTRFPGRFEAVASIDGMTNLLSFVRGAPPGEKAAVIAEFGDPQKNGRTLLEVSPIANLKTARGPVLLIQGTSDHRVPATEAIQFHEKLKARKVSSELILLPEEAASAGKPTREALELGQVIRFLKSKLLN